MIDAMKDAMYRIDAWERGANADEYVMEIAALRQATGAQHMTFEQLQTLVLQWSKDRKIIPNSTPVAQLFKAVSEMGELADAENKGHEAEICDAVGDILVCLINYCALRDLSLVGCLEGSYDEIKDRKGTLLPNGVFVKE